MEGDAHLFEVILALGVGCGFSDLLHRRQQQSNQDGDNRNDNQKFNQGKGCTFQQSVLMANRSGHKTCFAASLSGAGYPGQPPAESTKSQGIATHEETGYQKVKT
jgi:hypothetical protein